MTTYDDAGHLDLDRLADLLAGEGSEAAVKHLEGCAGCAGRLAELDAVQAPVTAALRALPVPPVPADLGDRLAAALATAGPLPAAERVVPGGPAPTPDEDRSGHDRPVAPPPVIESASTTVTPMRRRRSTPKWLPGAAVAVLVLGAGLFGLAQLGGSGSDSETAAPSSAGSAGEAQDSTAADALAGVAVNASGRDYGSEPGALAQALPAVLAGTAAGPSVAAAPPPAASPPAETQPAPASAPAPDAELLSTPGLERLRDPAGLASCLSALLPPGDPAVRPLALDYASYAGQPALVVVLPADEPAKVDVFVVGAGCEASNDATLFFTRLDRPA